MENVHLWKYASGNCKRTIQNEKNNCDGKSGGQAHVASTVARPGKWYDMKTFKSIREATGRRRLLDADYATADTGCKESRL
jgi:hypothetical protein